MEEAPALLGPIPAPDDDAVIVANLPFRSMPMIAPSVARPLAVEVQRSLEQIGVDGSPQWEP